MGQLRATLGPTLRSLLGGLLSRGGGVSAAAEAAAYAWDPEGTALGDVVLSDENLLATVSGADATGAVDLPFALPAGAKSVLKLTLVYPGADDAGELQVFVFVGDTVDTAVESYAFFCDGTVFDNVTQTDLAKPVATTQAMRLWVNDITRKIWMGNPAGPSGDPEAGTGQAFTYSDGLPVWLRATLVTPSGAVVSIAIDPDYTSGTYAAPTP